MINDNYVLTAAHCFCSPQTIKCQKAGSTLKVPYDVKTKVFLFMGVNGNTIDEKNQTFLERFKHNVDSVTLHPLYKEYF